MPNVSIDQADLQRILEENERLRQQVTDLQANNTTVVSQRRVEDIHYNVAAFHSKFMFPNRTTPVVPTADEIRFRARLETEEYFELMAAMFGTVFASCILTDVQAEIVQMIKTVKPVVDLVELADALCDLDYINAGTQMTFGIPRAAVLAEVQRSNMTKSLSTDGIGKPIKPEDWAPPDIRGVLLAHGWDGK